MKKSKNIFKLKEGSEFEEMNEYLDVSMRGNQKKKKKVNIFIKILIILFTLPVFYMYPFYFIFKSNRLKKNQKWIVSAVYLIPLTILFYNMGSGSDLTDVTSDQQLILTVNEVQIYQGQAFNPSSYISEDTPIESLEDIEILNSVNTSISGEYTIVYKINEAEKTLKVTVLEDPISIVESSITFELGESFDPLKNVESTDIDKYDIKVVNNVDYSQPGTYTVIYSFEEIEKTISVTISKPNTVEYTLANSDWLSSTTVTLGFSKNTVIEVDGGDISGSRQSSVAVDVGFGNREYWAFTNQYGQLIAVIAEEIILQDESTEMLLGDGRYYPDEAKVPGTEESDLDEGHVIADSCGGVANAYNITPQNSTLNRYGDQAYMEDWIRRAGGTNHFIAIITYANTTTQIPSHYSYTYILNGNEINDEFDNINPEKTFDNSSNENNENTVVVIPPVNESNNDSQSINGIDTNNNGIVTIAEAKAAGFSMPVYSDHWLYPYMVDRDSDGMVGESN